MIIPQALHFLLAIGLYGIPRAASLQEQHSEGFYIRFGFAALTEQEMTQMIHHLYDAFVHVEHDLSAQQARLPSP